MSRTVDCCLAQKRIRNVCSWCIVIWFDFTQAILKEIGLAFLILARASSTARAVATKHVKSIPPSTENWLRKLHTYSKKNHKSTEDKHETNHINKKYNDTNTNTRKMHNTWAGTQERVVFVSLWCWVTRTSWLKFWVPSCHPCTCASLLEFTSLTLYFDLSFTIVSLFFFLMHFEQHTELDNLIAMQNLRTSANKGSNDAYDVTDSITGS